MSSGHGSMKSEVQASQELLSFRWRREDSWSLLPALGEGAASVFLDIAHLSWEEDFAGGWLMRRRAGVAEDVLQDPRMWSS